MAERDNPGLVDDELDRDYEAHVASVRNWLKSRPGFDEADDPAIDNAQALPFADWLVATAAITAEARDRILAAMARPDPIPAAPIPTAPLNPVSAVQDGPTVLPPPRQPSKRLPGLPPRPTTSVVAPRPRLQIDSGLEYSPDQTAQHWIEGQGRRVRMVGDKTGLGEALADQSSVLAGKLEATEALNRGLSDRISSALAKLRTVKNDDDYHREGIQQEIQKITVALAQAESLRKEGFDVQADIDRCKEWYALLAAYGEKATLGTIRGEPFLRHRRQLQVMLVRLNREGLGDPAHRPDAAPVGKQPLRMDEAVPDPKALGAGKEPVTLVVRSSASARRDENFDNAADAAERDRPTWDPIDMQAEFPDVLRNTNWKKSAGFTGLGKTGIGESLRDLEGAFDQVKWDSIRIRTETRFTSDQLVGQLSDARAALDQESAAINKVKAQALHVLATTSAWRDKNKGKPRFAKALEYCERIILQATELIKSCDMTFLKLAQITRYDLRICAKSSTIESVMRLSSRVDDCLSAVNEVEGWDDWQRLQVAAKIREITLALQGIPGAIDYGYDVPVRDPERCAGLNEELKKYQLTDKRHSGDVGTHLAKLRAVLMGMRDNPVGVPEESNGTGPGDTPATRQAFIRDVVRLEAARHLAESELTQDDRDYFNSLPKNSFLHGTRVPGPTVVACVRGYFKFRDYERLRRETIAAA